MATSRLVAIVVCVTATAVMALPVSASVSDSSISKLSCKKKKEDKGCKLRKGTAYRSDDGDTVFSVGQRVVGENHELFEASAQVPAKGCNSEPSLTAVTVVGIKAHPKVGKTYTGTRADQVIDPDVPHQRRDQMTATVKVTSAKKAKVTIVGKILDLGPPGTVCNVNVTSTVKRET